MSAAKPLPPALAGGSSLPRRALVHASLATSAAVGRRGRHLTGTFCLTGDTMEGIIQCLVFLKAFSVSQAKNNGFGEMVKALTGIYTTNKMFFSFFFYRDVWNMKVIKLQGAVIKLEGFLCSRQLGLNY